MIKISASILSDRRPTNDRKEDTQMGKRKFATKKDRDAEYEYYCCKYRIYPTDAQRVFFAKTFGCVRFLWNQFLSDGSFHYQVMGTSLNNTPADYKDDYPFLKEIDSLALCNVQQNYQKAMSAFFDGEAEYPKFKKKGVCRESYTTDICSFRNFLESRSGSNCTETHQAI